MSLRDLQGAHLVVEEKFDGMHVGVCFDATADLWLFSGGEWIRDFSGRLTAPLLAWAQRHEGELLERLEDRYILHGEWMLAKHTVFYDELPDLLLEYDIYDRGRQRYLSTDARRALLEGTTIRSVPVLHEGPIDTVTQLQRLVGPSAFRSADQRQALEAAAAMAGVEVNVALQQTDLTCLMEGLYVKHEAGGEVVGRYKWIREHFLDVLLSSGSHWRGRPVIENQTAR